MRDFPVKSHAHCSSDPERGLQIFGRQPIQFADQDIEGGVWDRECDGSQDRVFCSGPPAWAGAKAQLEAGLEVQSACSFAETRALDQIEIVVAKAVYNMKPRQR